MKYWRINLLFLTILILAQPLGGCSKRKHHPTTPDIAEPDSRVEPVGKEGLELGGGGSGMPLEIVLLTPTVGHSDDREAGDHFVPYVTDERPEFTAYIISQEGEVTREMIHARLNSEAIEFEFNKTSGLWTFLPQNKLEEKTYVLTLRARDSLGNRASAFWRLKVDVTPPSVGMAFDGDNDNEIILSFSEPEYPEILKEVSRWSSEKDDDGKKESVWVNEIELIGDNNDMVKISLGESFERKDKVSRKISFNGPRGETWLERIKPGDKKRVLFDGEYQQADCTDYVNPDPSYGNPGCYPYVLGTVRAGDCWRDPDSGGFPDINHTHQSEESENHCIGTQYLGNWNAGVSQIDCQPCGTRDESASINVNLDNWDDIGVNEDMGGETPLFADRCETLMDLWPVNLAELQAQQPGFPVIPRSISTRYMDYGEILKEDCEVGPAPCEQSYDCDDWSTLINAWQWELFADTENPIFRDLDGQGTKVELITVHDAEDIAATFNGTQGLDFDDIVYVHFEIEDVGALWTLGWMGGETIVCDIGTDSRVNPGMRHWFMNEGSVGWLDLNPTVGTTDADGQPYERYLFLIPYTDIITMCVAEVGPCDETDPEHKLGCNPTLFFMVKDDLGNWTIEDLDGDRQISSSSSTPPLVTFNNLNTSDIRQYVNVTDNVAEEVPFTNPLNDNEFGCIRKVAFSVTYSDASSLEYDVRLRYEDPDLNWSHALYPTNNTIEKMDPNKDENEDEDCDNHSSDEGVCVSCGYTDPPDPEEAGFAGDDPLGQSGVSTIYDLSRQRMANYYGEYWPPADFPYTYDEEVYFQVSTIGGDNYKIVADVSCVGWDSLEEPDSLCNVTDVAKHWEPLDCETRKITVWRKYEVLTEFSENSEYVDFSQNYSGWFDEVKGSFDDGFIELYIASGINVLYDPCEGDFDDETDWEEYVHVHSGSAYEDYSKAGYEHWHNTVHLIFVDSVDLPALGSTYMYKHSAVAIPDIKSTCTGDWADQCNGIVTVIKHELAHQIFRKDGDVDPDSNGPWLIEQNLDHNHCSDYLKFFTWDTSEEDHYRSIQKMMCYYWLRWGKGLGRGQSEY